MTTYDRPRLLAAALGLLLVAGAMWFVFGRRPPHETVPIRAELLEIDKWVVDGAPQPAWPTRFRAASRIPLELWARPTHPVSRSPATTGPMRREEVTLFLVDKAHPEQPVPNGAALVEKQPGDPQPVVTHDGVIRFVETRPSPGPRSPEKPLDQSRVRRYSGDLVLPASAGEYVVMVAVSEPSGTYGAGDPRSPGALTIVRRYDIAID
ncbi:hypothetical protein [Planctomyces sp. SH-PL14]|uniref:hypothetical protein n=1 Tax=Planctomyces sp. SH-PL14 TaxID=1632864 RepID=UPI00078C5BD9|nr:hypothetical protein [Planctomyces sp. SH-PL14]AMV20232.1 hypothetical protein VT03_20210 [Planctomyces sp. SH-PL14]